MRAVVHHRHAFGDAQRHVHVVLDDDVADMAGQAGQDLDQFRPFGGRQARGRFVEQDEARAPASASAISSCRCWP
jgi:hypothetical protein